MSDHQPPPSGTAWEDVLAFWFSDPARWWKKDPAFDQEIRARFENTHVAILRGEHDDWTRSPRSNLAYVIVLDQFSRNMFRDTGRMFEGDARARAATIAAVDRGDGEGLSTDERNFLYMPLMHSESIADQDRSVELFRALGSNEKYAEMHRDIVRRFGRFPHRNMLVGRTSSADEVEFLKQPGSSF